MNAPVPVSVAITSLRSLSVVSWRKSRRSPRPGAYTAIGCVHELAVPHDAKPLTVESAPSIEPTWHDMVGSCTTSAIRDAIAAIDDRGAAPTPTVNVCTTCADASKPSATTL